MSRINTIPKAKKWFESAAIFDKEIVAIHMIGQVGYLSKDTFATVYNNSDKHEGKFRKSIKRSELDEEEMRTRYVNINGAFVLEFRDKTGLSIEPSDYSEFKVDVIDMEKYKGCNKGSRDNVDVGKMFSVAFGKCIIDVKVENYDKTPWEIEYINDPQNIKDCIRIIRLYLDNNMHFYFSMSGVAYMNKDNTPDVLTWREFLSYVDNADQYFDEE